jgi:metal-dependent amidase/aminoacylase/carboxypeptidase family protein
MFLTDRDVTELIEWRRRLHRMPELSGRELATAGEVRLFLCSASPDRIVTELGGHGVAAIGAGESHPGLHNPDYDFPDGLIEIGARVFMRTLRDLLG